MADPVPTWVDGPAGNTPLDAAHLNQLSVAIRDLQTGTAPALTPTAVKTSAYTAAAGDFVPVDTTSAGVTVTLPTAPADKTVLGVKHVIQGGTNTVSIACGGSDVFNKTGGSTTLTLSLLNQGALLQYKASSGVWYVVADDLALSQLDARYASPSYATSRAVALALVLGS